MVWVGVKAAAVEVVVAVARGVVGPPAVPVVLLPPQGLPLLLLMPLALSRLLAVGAIGVAALL